MMMKCCAWAIEDEGGKIMNEQIGCLLIFTRASRNVTFETVVVGSSSSSSRHTQEAPLPIIPHGRGEDLMACGSSPRHLTPHDRHDIDMK